MPDFIYKIRRNSDGLFSTGGGRPRFTKAGKTWTQRGHISNHLNLIRQKEKERIYGDCEVVKMEFVEVNDEQGPISVLEWSITDKTKRQNELDEIRREEQRMKYLQDQLRKKEKEIKNLKKKMNQGS